MTTVVSDASPLIALDSLGEMQILRSLFGTVMIPPAVMAEVSVRRALPAWIVEQRLSQPIPARVLQASLGEGETEAISLALEAGANCILLDDLDARRLARGLGLPIMGTLGVLLHAKVRGIVASIRPLVDTLVQDGFFVDESLYDWLLTESGEKP